MAALKVVVSLLALASDVCARRNARRAEKLTPSAVRNVDLPDCLEINTFPGKCSIAVSPGACYALDDSEWQCWSDDQPEDTKNEQTCKEVVEKDGACVFKTHGVKASDDELKPCKEVGFTSHLCHPVTKMWGACYHKDLGEWRCIPKNDPELIKRSREGDCKVTPVPGNDTIPYDDVCIIPSAEQIVYKCPAIPSYKADVPASSCHQENLSFACFSLREGVTWQCLTNLESVPSCESTQIPEGEQLFQAETYDGVCVHDTSPLFESAESAPPTTTTTTITTTTTTTTTTTKTTKTTTTTTATAVATTVTPGEATTTPNSEALTAQVNSGIFLVVSFLSTALLM